MTALAGDRTKVTTLTEVRFYHLQQSTLEQALPQLLERTIGRGWRAVVMARSTERVEALNGHLWTYNREGFLPHGSEKDGHAAEQPIWLTAVDENPNAANVLFLTDGAKSGNIPLFELCCDLFDGNDPDAVAAARDRWKSCKTEGFQLTYWQQISGQGWVKKAEEGAKPDTA